MSDATNRPGTGSGTYTSQNSEYKRALYDGYASVMLGLPPDYERYTSIVGGSAYANGRLDAMDIREHFPTLGFMDFDEFWARANMIGDIIGQRCHKADTSMAPVFMGCARYRPPHLVRQDLNERLKAVRLSSLAADDNMTTMY